MGKTIGNRFGVPLTAAVAIAALAGCSADSGDQERSVAQVLTAAYEKTSAASAAKAELTVSMPESMMGGAGELELSGVMGWNPSVVDMSMSYPSGEKVRTRWVGDISYVDAGAAAAKEMDGKRWMKVDYAALAEKQADERLLSQMTGGMEAVDQDPAKQLAVLLDSPDVQHIGEEKIDGVPAQRYRGAVTLQQMIDSGESAKVLGGKKHDALVSAMKEAGIKGYETEIWLDENDLPVKMDLTMRTADGEVGLVGVFTEYGIDAEVKAPPADETYDLMELLGGLEKRAEGEPEKQSGDAS
ncbi:hypothetical protein [Streptomyces jumonjinensis]|uniref:hypothetical protein n=1 Tax=Streptomyces jumonjinensis TaxID=1945 RepID=UPI0037A6AAF9